MTDDKSADLIKRRFYRIFLIFTPFLFAIAFLPAVAQLLNIPAFGIAEAVIADSAIRIIALSSLYAVTLVARTRYGEAEFRKLTTNFMLFALLFLTAEFLWYAVWLYNIQMKALFFLPHVFWLLGYIPLAYACWTTLLDYSEYAREKDVFLTSFLMLGIAVIIIIPVSVSIVLSTHLIPGEKVLAVLYPFIDCVVLFMLVFLLQIYRTGKLAFYWSAVTAGILLFTIGDISTAFVTAYGFETPRPFASGFFILGYSYLSLGLASVTYLQWRFSKLEPEGKFHVREVFLINKAGILISSVGPEKEGIDEDILGSMLTAVQDFVKDSFDREKESKERLKRLQYGGLEVELEHGRHVFLAVVLDGVGTERLHEKMRSIVAKIEEKYEGRLANWNGVKGSFPGLDNYLSELL